MLLVIISNYFIRVVRVISYGVRVANKGTPINNHQLIAYVTVPARGDATASMTSPIFSMKGFMIRLERNQVMHCRAGRVCGM